MRGKIGELLLKQMIAPYIPVPYEVGYGEVVNAAKETSGECDLIIFKKPVLLQVGHVTVVSRPNVKVIIQVQTNLDAKGDVKRIKANCKKQSKFGDKIVFVIYSWFLKEDTISEFKRFAING